MADSVDRKVFHANDIANFVVCPESWRLKSQSETRQEISTKRSDTSSRRRKAWLDNVNQWRQFRQFSKVIFVLLALLAGVVFLLESQRILDPGFVRKILKLE